ncbi:MAG: VOC family protein, partial [Myxococcota bacterium]
LAGVSPPVVIDLLQWLEPHDPSHPYPHLYHYGIARVALASSDLDADMAKLQLAGAEFLSKPAQMPPSSGSRARFVCFKDPDGTVLELVENAGL